MSCLLTYKNNRYKDKVELYEKASNITPLQKNSAERLLDSYLQSGDSSVSISEFLAVRQRAEKRLSKSTPQNNSGLINEESLLHKKLSSFPMVDSESAFETYKYTQSDSFKKSYGEPTEFTIDGGNISQKVAASIAAKEFKNPTQTYLTPDGTYTQDISEASLKSPILIAEKADANGDIDVETVRDLSNSDILIEENGEPKIVYKSGNGRYFTSYEKALDASGRGLIQIGVISPLSNVKLDGSQIVGVQEGHFNSLIAVSSSTNPKTRDGFINYSIKRGTLSPQQTYVDGEMKIIPKGETELEMAANAQLALDDATYLLGRDTLKVDENDFITIQEAPKNTLVLTDTKGQQFEVTIDELKQKVYDDGYQALEQYEDAPELAYLISQEMKADDVDKVGELKKPTRGEQELKLHLMNLLNRLGIKTMALSDYIDSYSRRNGTDITARALADLTNRIVAFAERAEVADISEELAHFVVEAFDDQNAINEILSQVEQSQEWAEHSVHYYEKYREAYPDANIDNLVRREILGKIIARKVQDNFNKQNETLPDTFIDKLKAIFDRVVNFIKQNLTSNSKNELERLTDEITEMILNEQIVNRYKDDKLSQSNAVMWSLEDKIRISSLQTALDAIEQQYRALSHSTSPVAGTVRKARQALKEAKGREYVDKSMWLAARQVVATVAATVTPLKGKFDYKGGITNEFLDKLKITQEDKVGSDMLDSYLDVLSELKQTIKDFPNLASKAERLSMERDIDSLVVEISNLKPKISKVAEAHTQFETFKFADSFGLEGEARERFIEESNRHRKDISTVGRYFSTLEHSSNPILKRLGLIINENFFKAREPFLRKIKPLLTRIQNTGFLRSDFQRLIKKFDDGKYSQFIENEYDMAKFHKAKRTAHYVATMKALNDGRSEGNKLNLTEEQFYQGIRKGTLVTNDKLSSAQRAVYEAEMFEWRLDNEEMYHTKEFYKQQQKDFDRKYEWTDEELLLDGETYKKGDFVPIHSSSIAELRSLTNKKRDILDKYRDPETRLIDYTKITEADQDLLDSIQIERSELKSELIPGTDERKSGYELKLALDIQAIDNIYKERFEKIAEEQGNRQLKNDFWDYLDNLIDTFDGDPSDLNRYIIKALQANGGIIFSDAYWEAVEANSTSYIDKVREKLKDVALTDTDRINLEDLERQLFTRKEILKRYRNPSNLTDIMFHKMTRPDINAIAQAEQKIQDYSIAVRNLFEKDGDVAPVLLSETTLNKAYVKAYLKSGLSELDFILEHVTSSDATAIRNYVNNITYTKEGKYNRTVLRHVRDHFGLDSLEAARTLLINHEVNTDSLALIFARAKVLPYFKMHAPVGYAEMMINLENGQGNIREFLKVLRQNYEGTRIHDGSVLDYLTVRPNYQWFEETRDDLLNPNYNKDFKGGTSQPKLFNEDGSAKYIDLDFFHKYGIDVNTFLNTGESNATINTSDFAMRQELLDVMENVHSNYGVEKSGNIYLLPQFSRTSTERLKATFSADGLSNIANAVRDISRTRIDEKDLGEQIRRNEFETAAQAENIVDYTGVRAIPKYGLSMLEEINDISHDLGYTYSLMLQQSELYAQKNNTLKDVMLYEQELRNRYKGVDNGGKATNTIKMFNEYVDYYFYGKNRTRRAEVSIAGTKVDLAKIIKFFDEKIVRQVNIGLNPAIGITAGTTSEVWLQLEATLGQYFTRQSLNWARGELAKLLPEFTSNYATINNESFLYNLMEMMGVKDLGDRTQNAGYNRIIRAGNNFLYKILEVTAFPITSRTVLSILDDHRLVGDRVVTFNEFSKLSDNNGKTSKQIKAEWSKFRKDSVYNMLEMRDGTIKIKKEYLDMFETENGKEHYLEHKFRMIQNKIISVNTQIDGTLSTDDRINATRDFILNFTTAHRGWFIINFQRLFKKYGMNYRTGQFEEGHMITVANLFNNTLISLKTSDHLDVMNAIKENWAALDDMQKRNVYRALLHTALFASMLIVGTVIAKSLDDDEPDPWLAQFGSYIYFRTMNEVGSMHPVVGMRGVVDMVQTPFVALNSVKQLVDPSNYSFDKVKSGKYEGHSKIYTLMAKQTWLRHYYDTKDIDMTLDSYRHFNKETLFWLGK